VDVMPVIICGGRCSLPKCIYILKNCNFTSFWQDILLHVCLCECVFMWFTSLIMAQILIFVNEHRAQS